MRIVQLIFGIVLLISLAAGVGAEEQDLKDHPGYIDLDEIKIPGNAGEVTEISLGPALLNFAAQMSENGDEDLSENLSELMSIRVKSFDVDSTETEKIKPIFEKIEKKLAGEKWERVIRVKEKDELTNISVKYDEGAIVGLLVMALESGKEVTFVNIVGKLDLNSLGNLGTISLDESVLDSLKKSTEGKDTDDD